MSDSTLDLVRARVKEQVSKERHLRREKLYNQKRGFVGISNTQYEIEDVERAATTLTSNSNLDEKEEALNTLKGAFMQENGKSLITCFAKKERAVHDLVSLLKCHNPMEQLLALECCCNMSLGNSTSSFKLAKTSLPYIITMLHGMNYSLVNVAALTVGNLFHQGNKVCQLLISQGVINALLNGINIPDTRDSCAQALCNYVFIMNETISEEDKLNLVKNVISFYKESAYIQWLLSMFSSEEFVLQIFIPNIIYILQSLVKQIDISNVVSITAQIRTLANLISLSDEGVALFILDNIELFLNGFNNLVASQFQHLKQEAFWAFGNIFQHKSELVQKKLQFIDFSKFNI